MLNAPAGSNNAISINGFLVPLVLNTPVQGGILGQQTSLVPWPGMQAATDIRLVAPNQYQCTSGMVVMTIMIN